MTEIKNITYRLTDERSIRFEEARAKLSGILGKEASDTEVVEYAINQLVSKEEVSK